RAKGFVHYRDRSSLLDRRARGRRTRIGNLERLVVKDSDLARDSKVPEAVRPVARHLEIDREVPTDVTDRLEIEARKCEPFGQWLDGDVELQVIREPVPTDDHGRVLELQPEVGSVCPSLPAPNRDQIK